MRQYQDPDYRPEEFARLRELPVASEEIFDGAILHVVRDRVRLPGGHLSFREKIVHRGAVCIVPVTEDGQG